MSDRKPFWTFDKFSMVFYGLATQFQKWQFYPDPAHKFEFYPNPDQKLFYPLSR